MNDNDDSIEEVRKRVDQHRELPPTAVEEMVLAVSHESAIDELSAALDAADWLVARAKGISELSKRIAIEWIEHNGEFNVGQIRYSVEFPTTTKCVDLRGCGVALLDALGGDFDEFLSFLSAQPYKYGSVASVLEKPVYRSFFTTKSAARLINGVPERALKRTDTRFALPRRRP